MTHSNQWLEERADLLATVTEWRERAEKAEARVARLTEIGNHLRNLIQICSGVPISGIAAEQAVDAARAALKAMEATDD